jgi:ferrous iron transport protein A
MILMRMIIVIVKLGGKSMIKTLNQLQPGETGVVTKILGSGPVRRRIVDMGIVSGTQIKVQKYAPLGDPMEIKAKNFNLSLRKSEAALIEVKPS